MTKLRNLRIEEKLKAIACAETYGIGRAATYYQTRPDLVSKWIREKDKIAKGVTRRRKRQTDYMKARYAAGGQVKQYSRKEQKADSTFIYLSRSLKRAGRDRGIEEYPSAIELWRIALRQKLKCAVSGLPLTRENISPDHRTPFILGGTNTAENIQLVDKRVNIMKHAMLEAELIDLCKAIVKYRGHET